MSNTKSVFCFCFCSLIGGTNDENNARDGSVEECFKNVQRQILNPYAAGSSVCATHA